MVIGIVVVVLVAVCLCRYCKPKRQVETVDYEEHFSRASFVEDKELYEAASAVELSSVVSDTNDEVSAAYNNLHLQFLCFILAGVTSYRICAATHIYYRSTEFTNSSIYYSCVLFTN